jgi:hypothetical protein
VSEVNLFEVEVTKDAGDPDGYHASYARIAPLVGGRLLGLSVYELPSGQSICPYHYEIGFEEWLLVLTGSPTLRTPAGERNLRPWDVAFFPEGADGANKHDPAAAVYPDSDKIGIFPPNKLFRLAEAVDYWDGEV